MKHRLPKICTLFADDDRLFSPQTQTMRIRADSCGGKVGDIEGDYRLDILILRDALKVRGFRHARQKPTCYRLAKSNGLSCAQQACPPRMLETWHKAKPSIEAVSQGEHESSACSVSCLGQSVGQKYSAARAPCSAPRSAPSPPLPVRCWGTPAAGKRARCSLADIPAWFLLAPCGAGGTHHILRAESTQDRPEGSALAGAIWRQHCGRPGIPPVSSNT